MKQTSLGHAGRDHAWAIELKASRADRIKGGSPPAGPSFAGVFNWTNGLEIPVCMRGATTALFETRADARQAAKKLYFGPRRAVVRKVAGTLEILPERMP